MSKQTKEQPIAIEMWKRTRLKKYEQNARTHSEEQVEKIAASIREFGFTNPILIDKDGEIIAGHGRLEAATLMELDEVPVIMLGHLSDTQKRAYVLADNRLALDAGWDEDILARELQRLDEEGYDLANTGFAEEEIIALLPDFDEDQQPVDDSWDEDDLPNFQAKHTSTAGDIWRLGRYRLMCGNSTSHDDLKKLMDGKRTDCVWTDPPYNVNYEGTAGKIMNDNMSDDDFYQFLLAVFSNAYSFMHDGAPIYVAHAEAGPLGVTFRASFMAAGFKLASSLVWRKNMFVLGRADYHWKHEPIIYGWKPGEAHRWYGARNKTTVIELDSEIITRTGENEYHIDLGETSMIITGENIQVQEANGSVLFEDRPSHSSEHPTMKPVALIERMLENSSQRGDIVLDLFGGSGSTLIACEKLKRDARMMELDPKFVDVIIERWQEFTGRPARLDSSGETFSTVREERTGITEDQARAGF